MGLGIFARGLNPASKLGITANALSGLAGDILWKVYGKPDVMLGIIPIFTAQRYEVARSHDKMKYRAVAGQFFAHQRGGNVGFKCVLYLMGPQALWYLTYIQALHILGAPAYDKIKDIASAAAGAVPPAGKAPAAISSFGSKDTSWMNEEKHWTFPIITREEIMHDMYIETVVYERDVQMGDAIKLTIMCRQYHRPPDIQYIQMKNGDGILLDESAVASQLVKGPDSSSIKEIQVAYKSIKSGRINAMAIAENFAHRWYVNNLADPMSDLEKTRSVAGRLDSVYNIFAKGSGRKMWKSVTDSFVSYKSNFIANIVPGLRSDLATQIGFEIRKGFGSTISSNQAKLTNKQFVDIEGSGESLYLDDPDAAELLDTIGPSEGANIAFNDNGISYILTVEVSEDKILGASKIETFKENRPVDNPGNLPIVNNTSSRCYIKGKSFIVIIYPNGNDYEIYRYSEKTSEF